jgi:hypothetical protein
MNSKINGNADSASAGGIFNDYGATLTVIDSTISGNSGAAIINESGGTIAITSSTISGNSGTGIANGGSAVTIIGSTISGNTGGYSGGGINTSAGTVTLANTIVAGNIATTSPDISGTYTDNGGNIVGGVNGVTASNVNLAPLASYGGPTKTLIPEPGSPAICAGLASNIPAGVTTDQRGFPNTNTTYPGYNASNPCVDSGAVQTNYAIAFTTQPPSYAVQGSGLNPWPVVGLTESGVPISISAGTVTMSDTAGLLTGTLSIPITSGAAEFGDLIFLTTTTGDTLKAMLALTSSIELTAQATTEITVLLPQTIAFGTLPEVTFGVAPFTVSATASSGLPVSFESITTPVCTVSDATVTLAENGICTIRASQAGDAAYAPATNVYQSFYVHGEAQTITFPAIPDTPLATGSVTLDATASSGLTVNYASTTLPVCTVSGNTVTLIALGTCVIEAKQPGGGGHDPAAWVTQSFNVIILSQTITFPAPPPVTYGAAPFTLYATASSGLAVSFESTTASVCTVLDGTVTLVEQGVCTIKASQAGDASYKAATNVYQSFDVHGEAQTITFPAIPATPLATGSVTLNATASSGLPVSYASTTSSVCTVTGSTVTLVAAGTCIIEAKQPGGGGYDPAAWVTQSFNVTN